MSANLQRDGSVVTITIGNESVAITGRPTEITFSYNEELLAGMLTVLEQKVGLLSTKLAGFSYSQLCGFYHYTQRREAFFSSFIEDEVKERKGPELERICRGLYGQMDARERKSFLKALDGINYARRETENGDMGEEILKLVHKTVIDGANKNTLELPEEEVLSYSGVKGGQYRTSDQTKVKDNGGIVFVPAMAPKLESLMKDFFQIDSAMLPNPFIRAGVIQMALGYIHPFDDGNGRTIRPTMANCLSADVLMEKNGVNFRLSDFVSMSEAFCSPQLGGFKHGYLAVLGGISKKGYQSGNFDTDSWMQHFMKSMDKALDLGIGRAEELLRGRAH